MSAEPQIEQLLNARAQVVARSFYKELRGQGFSPEQVIHLSALLLEQVTEEMRTSQEAAAK